MSVSRSEHEVLDNMRHDFERGHKIMASDAKVALRVIAQLEKQLARANGIVGWMMPYIGSMCPPSNGLADLNEHCCDNIIRPRMDDETKGPSIRQRSRGARPDGVSVR